MDILLNLLSLIGPIILAWYINTLQSISMQVKMILWIVCAVIFILVLYLIFKDYFTKKEKTKRGEILSQGLILRGTRPARLETHGYMKSRQIIIKLCCIMP